MILLVFVSFLNEIPLLLVFFFLFLDEISLSKQMGHHLYANRAMSKNILTDIVICRKTSIKKMHNNIIIIKKSLVLAVNC